MYNSKLIKVIVLRMIGNKRLLLPYKPVCQLRSSHANLLAVPPSRLKAYGIEVSQLQCPIFLYTLLGRRGY